MELCIHGVVDDVAVTAEEREGLEAGSEGGVRWQLVLEDP